MTRAEREQKYRELFESIPRPGGQEYWDWVNADISKDKQGNRVKVDEHGERVPMPAWVEAVRRLATSDLYFLLIYLLGRKDLRDDWLHDRCVEVQRSPDSHLDLWAREHYKSTIITYAKSIQDILRDPETTIGIFSHTRPIAKDFLEQVKREFEGNELLKQLFSDVLWQQPKKKSPCWSLDDGIVVRRFSNPRESTVEAHGLMDGQPIGKHYRIMVYDDVVTERSVYTPEMIHKTTRAWELSLNLGSRDGRHRYVGTRYHFNDTYKVMIDRGTVVPRIYPATDNGKMDGEPVLLTKDQLMNKRRDMGPYTFSSQMLLDPKADEVQGFDRDWLRVFDWENFSIVGLNLYLLCDPAHSKKKSSDYTAMLVLGLGPDENIYVVDGLRDRLNLTERAKAFIKFHRKYRPIEAGYEEYGLQADIQHIQYLQERQNYRFDITPLKGTTPPKEDRIRRLVPIAEQNRLFLPPHLYFIDAEGRQRDLVPEFINEEYEPFPAGGYDDVLDCMSRIEDEQLGAMFPDITEAAEGRPEIADMDGGELY